MAVDAVEDTVPIHELYLQCAINEASWTKVDYDQLKLRLTKAFLFEHHPQFPSAPTRKDSSRASSPRKNTALRIEMALNDGNKYCWLLDLLKNAPDRNKKLFIIAWWLTQEKICEPEEIIGVEQLRHQASKWFRWLSGTDFHHAEAVRAWIPYFDRLIRDSRVDSSKLVKQGYDEKAVCAALKKRSPISASCEWLAARLGVDSPTLANAYSRIYGRKYRAFRKRIRSGCG